MKVVRDRLFQREFDSLRTQLVLRELAADYQDMGYEVTRGVGGQVILHFPDGEVRYVPSVLGVREVVLVKEVVSDGR